ncbi:DUF2690 domain-containing protein [Streptomyces europaeiscabiei]|uniref:DUF2690 domain-containing protein n=1 Tax=Streptomyces europaeiscabiei TaxID=146819 RepID=UPI0029B437C9|nr:DUF2690 domain-containing protein [Streptomyces europaeiscabiei]MDX3586179.1 DUF2690 domain-containing protein [Streptomyces europaeiscabiei]
MLELNRSGRRKTPAMAFAAAGCATVLTLQSASAAHAASPYDGADPAATGCSSNAKTLASAPLYLPNTTSQVGTIEMRYSNTCLTQWIRVHSSVTKCSPHACRNDAQVTRPAGADGPALTVGRGNVAAGEPYQWSLMVYTPQHPLLRNRQRRHRRQHGLSVRRVGAPGSAAERRGSRAPRTHMS